MERIDKSYQVASQAVRTLEKVVSDYKSAQTGLLNMHIMEPEDFLAYMRDALIQRFEYSFDALWKHVKLYLSQKFGIALPPGGPSMVFRECFKARLLTEEEVAEALKMVEHRNLTSHVYLENIAERVSVAIPEYLVLMKKILKKTAVKL